MTGARRRTHIDATPNTDLVTVEDPHGYVNLGYWITFGLLIVGLIGLGFLTVLLVNLARAGAL